MIITIEKHGNGGRLGNQLHLIASTIGISKKLGARAIFPEWEYSKYFAGGFEQSKTYFEPTHIWTEPNFHYAEFRLEDCVKVKEPNGKIIIQIKDSYLQSEKYWAHCKEEVLQIFKIEKPLNVSTQFCSIHFRFKDYVGNPFYEQLTMENYYKKAIEFFLEKGVFNFVVFSDDVFKASAAISQMVDLEQENSPINKALFTYGSSSKKSEMDDFSLMSKLHHNIIANSSFSHWASILNQNPNKIVLAPAKWFTQPFMNTKDMYSEGMILI